MFYEGPKYLLHTIIERCSAKYVNSLNECPAWMGVTTWVRPATFFMFVTSSPERYSSAWDASFEVR